MDCKELRNNLTHYIYGELLEEEEEQVRKHIDNCGRCYREYLSLLHTRKLLSNWRNITPSPALAVNWRANLEEFFPDKPKISTIASPSSSLKRLKERLSSLFNASLYHKRVPVSILILIAILSLFLGYLLGPFSVAREGRTPSNDEKLIDIAQEILARDTGFELVNGQSVIGFID